MTHPLLGAAVAEPAVGFSFAGLLGIVALVLVLANLVLLGLKEGWAHTIGYGLRWLANEIEDVGFSAGWFGSVHPFGFLARALRHADHVVAHAIAVAAINTESASAALFHMASVVFWWHVHETKALAFDVWHAFDHTITVTIPDAAKWARRDAFHEAHRLVHREAAVRRSVDAELHHLAHVAEADALHGIREAEHALDWSEAQVGLIGKELRGIRARLRKLELDLSHAGVVGLVIAALGTMGLGALRCPGFLRLLKKHGCGLGGLLEGLLGLAISAFALDNVCRMLPILEAAFGEVIGPVIHLLTEVPLGGCEVPPKGWARLSVQVGPLPPPQTLGALPV